jgi:hypothetical protein
VAPLRSALIRASSIVLVAIASSIARAAGRSGQSRAPGTLNQDILPHPVGTPGGKPQTSAKKERERPYFPQPHFAGGAPQNPVSSKSEEKQSSLGSSLGSNLSARWRRCDAANRPADARPGRPRATDARHSRHARSRNHHGHRAATVTPQSPQAAGKLPCATILSSLDAADVDCLRTIVCEFIAFHAARTSLIS